MLLNQIKIDPNVQPFKQAPHPMRIESLKKRLSSRQKSSIKLVSYKKKRILIGWPAVFQWRKRKDKYACGDFRDLNKAYSKDEFSLPVTDSHWSHRHSFMSWHIHNFINIYISINIKRTIHNVFWEKNQIIILFIPCEKKTFPHSNWIYDTMTYLSSSAPLIPLICWSFQRKWLNIAQS